MASSTLDLEAVRAEFPALDCGVAFLDAPGGTQCPSRKATPDASAGKRARTASRSRVAAAI